MSLKQALLLTDSSLQMDGPYLEKVVEELPWYDRAARVLSRHVGLPIYRQFVPEVISLRKFLPLVEKHSGEMAGLSDEQLRNVVPDIRAELLRKGLVSESAGRCFALIREVAGRTVGKRHYPTQMMAGWGMLQGHMVEMQTGEGKTLSATLAAATAALLGCPVHVITVNDYLATRDADEMNPIYTFLGLRCAAISDSMSAEEKSAVYAGDITYCTNKDLAFDYLRDRVALGQSRGPLQLAMRTLAGAQPAGESSFALRGLFYAIVDEADSVFVDDARTPLILSKSVPSEVEEENCRLALEFAGTLADGIDYLLELRDRNIRLTDAGIERLKLWAQERGGAWSSTLGRRELIIQALSALYLFRRDHQYVVQDDKIQIVDESTGRIMEDRSWERGLHQMIEKKEGCEFTERRETLARITYQRLFQRYLRLSGMTGTAREIRGELDQVYDLKVVDIPLHRDSQRRYLPRRVLPVISEKWHAVADRVAELEVQQRAVLIGTRSVGASEEVSRVLTERGIDHALLNAKQDGQEADIIAQAGQPKRVTVATNMAGRGTDIHLHQAVADSGGLHVILTEYHPSRRLDRQLFGRCARQGDPGSCEAIVSLEDELFAVYATGWSRLAAWWMASGVRVPNRLFDLIIGRAQAKTEKRDAARRTQNMKIDRQMEKLLAFSGRSE